MNTLEFWKDERLQNYFEYSRLVIKQYAKSFYYSARLFPQSTKWATYAVYAFCRYVDNIVDNPRNRTESELRKELDRIREELELVYRYGESEHPALGAFAYIANRYKIPKELSLELIAGAEMDLSIDRYETFDDLYVFAYRVAAVVGLMMTHVMGYDGREETLKGAEELGIGMQLTNILRDVSEDLERGRIYIPKEDMDKFGLTETELSAQLFTPKVKKLMEFQVARAKTYYDSSYPLIDKLSKESQFAIYSASKIYGSILDEIEKNGFNPFVGRAFVTSSQKTKIVISELLGTRLKAYRAA